MAVAAIARVEISMTPEVAEIVDAAKRDIALMTPVTKTSVRYYDCLAEFGGFDGHACCAEYAEAWEDAVRALKQAREDETP